MSLDSLVFYSIDLEKSNNATSTFLFNDLRHLILQAPSGWKLYGLRSPLDGSRVLQIAFHIDGHVAKSPLRAPFGSIESYSIIGSAVLIDFIRQIVTDLKACGVHRICIKNYPAAYHETFSQLLYSALVSEEFLVTEETGSVLKIDNTLFEEKLISTKKHVLKKGSSIFNFHLVNHSNLENVYNFIAECLSKKQQSVSMSLQELAFAIHSFPQHYLLFTVTKNEELAAAAIVVKVNESILYTYCYAHRATFDKESPIVFLLAHLYAYAQEQQFTLIDLGTSMSGGIVNESLLWFKQSLGAITTAKYTFEKHLA